MQCLRRYVDERDSAHIANGGKYLSALVAVALRIQYGRNSAAVWAVMFVLFSIVATVYQVYWDLVVDWGLLRKDSSNKWLRDQLIMPKKKFIYFISMVTYLTCMNTSMLHFATRPTQIFVFESKSDSHQLVSRILLTLLSIMQVLNVFLRLAWLQSVTRFRFGTLDIQVADFIFASLEVIRRGHWNFYRYVILFLLTK